jgi:hypothetical protein
MAGPMAMLSITRTAFKSMVGSYTWIIFAGPNLSANRRISAIDKLPLKSYSTIAGPMENKIIIITFFCRSTTFIREMQL